MRIRRVHIENFRAIQNIECEFDDVTVLIGPNGAGKSTILRALDWFFNGIKGSVGESDLFVKAAPGSRIRVRVDFTDLTQSDREALGSKYAPVDSETFTAWRTFEDGDDKITGKALAFAPFEAVRAAQSASEKKAALAAADAGNPELELPRWTTLAGTAEAMDAWERDHPALLTDAEVSDSHFFGFHGQGKLSGLFDFVFVSADLRAADESQDNRDTVAGRILMRAVDSAAFGEAIATLTEAFVEQQRELGKRHLSPQLASLAEELTHEVQQFTHGRELRLTPIDVAPKPTVPKVGLTVADAAIETPVANQGHGFQRALLLAALRVLARHGTSSSELGTVCLAIEEPELFQHPTQARALASALRQLATNPDDRVQVAYATHSPYFVEPAYFDQVRRVTRTPDKEGVPAVTVSHASVSAIVARLEGFAIAGSVARRFEQVCLKSLPEALFAEAVILVEGEEDAAILEGASQSPNLLAVQGVAVAAVGGKTNMLLPHAILAQLGISALCVVDNDSECRVRMERRKRDATDIEAAVLETESRNRSFCRYFGVEESDYPLGVMSSEFVAMPDTLESTIERDWPEWAERQREIVKDGRGVEGKNAATYALAAKECSTPPSGMLALIVEAIASFR